MTPDFPHPSQGTVVWDSCSTLSRLCLGGYHPLWRAISGYYSFAGEEVAGPLPYISREFTRGIRFGLFPFRSLLLRESRLVSFPPPTKMLPFGGFPLREGAYTRKSHSGILGSKAACASPRRYRGLPRPSSALKPSHPPDSVACFGPMVVSVWRLVKQHVSLCVASLYTIVY